MERFTELLIMDRKGELDREELEELESYLDDYESKKKPPFDEKKYYMTLGEKMRGGKTFKEGDIIVGEEPEGGFTDNLIE